MLFRSFVVMSMLFVKGFFFVNFELLSVFCHRLPKGSLLDSKDLGTNVFRSLMCNVGKP